MTSALVRLHDGGKFRCKTLMLRWWKHLASKGCTKMRRIDWNRQTIRKPNLMYQQVSEHFSQCPDAHDITQFASRKKNCAPREGEKGDLYSILRKQCKTAISSSWRQNNKNCGMLRGEGSSTSDKKSRHLALYKLSANLPCYAYLPLRMHKTTTKIDWLLYKWRHKVWPTGNHSVDNPACSREAKKY